MTNAYCCPICQATYRQNCRACGMVYVPRKNGDHFWVDRRTNQRVHTADSMWAFEAKMISAEEIDRDSRRIASPQFSTVTSTDLSKHAVSSTYLGAVESFRAEVQDALQFFQAQQDNFAVYKQINDALTPPMCLSCEVKPRWSKESRCVDCQRDYKKKEAQRKARREAEQRRKSMQASCDPCGSDVVRQELADVMANRDVTEAKDAGIPSWDPLNAAPMLHWLPTPPEPEVFPRFMGGDKKTVALAALMLAVSLTLSVVSLIVGMWWAAPLWLVPSVWTGWLERTDRQAKIQRYYDAIHRRATADWENGRHEVLKEHQS